LSSVCTAMSVHLPSYMLCLVSLSSFVIYNSYSHTNYIHTFVTSIHSYFHIFIHIIYTASFTHDYISLPESCFGCVSSIRSLLVIVSSPKFLQRNILHLPSCHQKCHPKCVWSRDVTHYKPGGLRQIFYEAQWILANSYETFYQAEWILANVYQKPSGFSQTSYQKPSGFSQTSYQKPSGFSQTFYQKSGFSQTFYQSRVDSRKPFIKAKWILANVYQAEWILANVYQAEWILANLLSKPSGFSHTFTKPGGFQHTFTKPNGF